MADTKETLRDQLIEAIFDVLPATSYAEIASKVNKRGKLRTSVGLVNNAISHLRAHSVEYEWTIPHVKRGAALVGEEGRYLALTVDRQGQYELDSNPDAARHINAGVNGTIQQIATMMQNLTAYVRIAATHTRSINSRAKWNDLADDGEYLARKAAAIVREIKAA